MVQRGLRVSRDFRVLGQLAGGVRAEVVSSLIPSEARKDDKNRKPQLFNMCLRGLCHQWIFFFSLIMRAVYTEQGLLVTDVSTGGKGFQPRSWQCSLRGLSTKFEGASWSYLHSP